MLFPIDIQSHYNSNINENQSTHPVKTQPQREIEFFHLLSLSLLRSEYPHDEFLFLDEERSHYSLPYTFGTAEFFFAVATFGSCASFLCVQVHQFTSWSFRLSSAIGLGVVRESSSQN